MENKDFYDYLANVYDKMIDFDAALKRRKELLANIVGSYKTAADLGCGTGIDSIALSSLGLTVDAYDASEQMINRARENAIKHNAEISFYNSPLEEIPVSKSKIYDLIVSLGNTLATLNEDQLRHTMIKCNSLLAGNGKIIIQMLNYNIIHDNSHLIYDTENDEYHVIRYYDKSEHGLLF